MPSLSALSLRSRSVLVGGLAVVLLTPPAVAYAAPDGAGEGASERSGAARATVHSSDGVHGPTVRQLLAARQAARLVEPATAATVDPSATASPSATATPTPTPTPTPVEPEQAWDIAAGIGYREWTVRRRQGQVRVHLVTADLDQPGVALDSVSGSTVTSRAPLSRLLAGSGTVIGVNADFFDIYDTGAPLGVGRESARGLRHAPRTGWNNVVAVGADGTPRVGTAGLTGEVRASGRKIITLSGYNSPVLTTDQVGAYTPSWGTRPGRRVAEGATKVRQVVIKKGRVVSNTLRPTSTGTVQGTLLLGRDRGARALARMRVGERAKILTRAGQPGDRAAVGGSVVLLQGGTVTTSDDGELHPRTVFGYDRDTRQVLLLVADGRSESSSGLTLLQCARLLRTLGAEDGLNLDGGGSSTLVAPDALGGVGVRNVPSSGGRERSVPNALVVRY